MATRRARITSIAGAALLTAGLGLASADSASASTPPPDGDGCNVVLNGEPNGNGTVTMGVRVTDCGNPPYLVQIYFQAQRDNTILDNPTKSCFDGSTVQQCAADGVQYTTADPAGTQNYQWGAEVRFYTGSSGDLAFEIDTPISSGNW